jgi:hypothetical protein
MHKPHVWCRLFGLVALEVNNGGCSGSRIVAALVPPQCPEVQPRLF